MVMKSSYFMLYDVVCPWHVPNMNMNQPQFSILAPPSIHTRTQVRWYAIILHVSAWEFSETLKVELRWMWFHFILAYIVTAAAFCGSTFLHSWSNISLRWDSSGQFCPCCRFVQRLSIGKMDLLPAPCRQQSLRRNYSGHDNDNCHVLWTSICVRIS